MHFPVATAMDVCNVTRGLATAAPEGLCREGTNGRMGATHNVVCVLCIDVDINISIRFNGQTERIIVLLHAITIGLVRG